MKRFFKKSAAILLAAAMFMTTVPCFVMQATAALDYDRVADPSTMNDWQNYFGETVLSTEHAGGVWTDKSVLTDPAAFDGTGIEMSGDGDSFLVALSAIASNTSVEGLSNIPTDVMLVLDCAAHDTPTMDAMLRAANNTLYELQQIGAYNRVGVVAYDSEEASLLLPMGRYAYDGDSGACTYLTSEAANGKTVSVYVDAHVRDENGDAVHGTFAPADTTGTYTQRGILTALNDMLHADPKISQNAEHMAGQTRIPVMVLVSGSHLSAASSQYTAASQADMGSRLAHTAFTTQLTAAYAKAKLDEHYTATEPLLYTLGFGENTAADVMDPEQQDRLSATVLDDEANHTSSDIAAAMVNRTINAYWTMLLNDGLVNMTVDDRTLTVSKTTVGDEAFPSDRTQKYYVDDAFRAMNADTLVQAFATVVKQIEQQSHYYPTLVENNEDVSGYISFTDHIGDHMSVTDIKGILIDNTLFSGAMLSRNFVTGGGDLGSYEDPTSLGDELVWAVKARLGVDAHTARDLLGLAYQYGQLSYKSETDFSNYIGWYANAAGEFLGFWYDGMTTMPDPADPQLNDATRPAYIIRSYGFLGAVDEAHGVVSTDMMYATVQIREHITNGTEEMLFSVPAALIPTVTYEIAFDDTNELSSFEVGGAKHPVRLVYEVALDSEIDALMVHEWIDSGSVTQNTDGSVDFYTNAYEADHSVGYGTVNTNVHFIPSHQNERYYYTEDTAIYADTVGTLYRGDNMDTHMLLYRAFRVYGSRDGALYTNMMYERISSQSLSKAQRHDDGYWYIPADTVHTMLELYEVEKTNNRTNTLPFVYNPFVDTRYTYYVGGTLGNNGRLTMMPETGIILQNQVSGEETEASLGFIVTHNDSAVSATYPAVSKAADGTLTDTEVSFKSGIAEVILGDGELLFILGLTAGESYTVSTRPHADYKLVSVNGDTAQTQLSLTLTNGILVHADFEYERKGFGDVVIINRVVHDFGASYEIPDKAFTVMVQLPSEYAGTTLRAEYSADSALTSVTTNADAAFTITLRHTDQLKLFDLHEGIVVTICQTDIPAGFVPTYSFVPPYIGVGMQNSCTITVRGNDTVSAILSNRYQPSPVEAINIAVTGTVQVLGREDDQWLDEDVYTVALERHTDNGWVTVATQTVDGDHRLFDFSDAMYAEHFEKSGVYSYQLVQTIGNAAGVVYDLTVHPFSVMVGDVGMCGRLHIMDVTTYLEDDLVSGNETDGWLVSAVFTNRRLDDGYVDVAIDIESVLVNHTGSDRVSVDGYRFGLYADGGNEPLFVSALTDRVGEARLVASFDEVGVYRFTLREIIPANRINGMVYSAEFYTVQIDITASQNGALQAAVTLVDENGQVVMIPTFTNSYAPKAATVLPEVRAVMIGRDLQADELRYFILSADENLSSGTNRTDGTVVFDRALCFDEIGDYYFDICQVIGDRGGVTYDLHVHSIHVTVTDGGNGSLEAHYHVVDDVSNVMTFVNIYETTPIEVPVSGFVQLVGRDLINEEFSFVLVDADNPRNLVLTASNYADGIFRFTPVTLYGAGTYHYAVYEVQQSVAHGIAFDTATYDVYVTATDLGDGQLQVQTMLYKNGVSAERIVFTNAYTTTQAIVTLAGVVQSEGRELIASEFAVELYEADSGWKLDKPVSVAYNDNNGSFAFEPLMFDEAGVYRFVLKARYGGKTLHGISYDDAVYRVLVTVTDNRRGTLSAGKTILDASDSFVELPLFCHVSESTSTQTTTATTVPSVVSTTVSATTTTALTDATSATTVQTNNPYTGEDNATACWIVLMLVGISVYVALFVGGKKQTA